MSRIQKSIVACATQETKFAERIKEAAQHIGKKFITADRLALALKQCKDHLSSCIVVDYGTAFESPPNFRERRILRDSAVLVALPSGNVHAAFRAANAGATGVLDVSFRLDQLATCIQAALQSDSETRRTGRFDHEIYAQLKEREKGILFHLMAGEPNKRVASILDIGLRTVEAGRAELMKKLAVSSFAELIAFVTEVEHERFVSRRRVYESIIDRGDSRRCYSMPR